MRFFKRKSKTRVEIYIDGKKMIQSQEINMTVDDDGYHIDLPHFLYKDGLK